MFFISKILLLISQFFFFPIFLPLYLTHLHGWSKKIFRYHGMSKDLGPAVESQAVDRKLDVRVK